ncbi:Pupal cuticle protein 27 [Amphibalanus amphitrite]|uniref:Pupal cuticle protein 27 n=1 Tax=Amphibalanus amphitrite TaxID=1232801 RepID=A0A6A4WC44_AMPAM|nr:Pupal cuticle protein 27 [Amphibalanus amphitrite]
MTPAVFLAVLSVASTSATAQFTQDNVAASVPAIRILSQKFQMDQRGNYLYAYKQSNGQIMREVGRVQRGPQKATGSLTQQGEFQFVGDDGQTYQLSYTADEGGFQPQASHLPVAPAQIPEYDLLRQQHPELFWAERL